MSNYNDNDHDSSNEENENIENIDDVFDIDDLNEKCIDIYMCIQEYTEEFSLPICENLSSIDIYSFVKLIVE